MARAATLRALSAALALATSPARAAPPPAAALAAEQDVTRAFAAAKAKGALVLVDVWAPW